MIVRNNLKSGYRKVLNRICLICNTFLIFIKSKDIGNVICKKQNLIDLYYYLLTILIFFTG